MTFPTCTECRRHVEEYRQAVLEREQMRADLAAAVAERDAAKAELAAVDDAISDRGVPERDCRLPLPERVNNILSELKSWRSDFGKEALAREQAEAERDALKKDQGDWRKGVRLIASYLGENNPTDLCCVRIANVALRMRADAERVTAERDDLRARVDRLANMPQSAFEAVTMRELKRVEAERDAARERLAVIAELAAEIDKEDRYLEATSFTDNYTDRGRSMQRRANAMEKLMRTAREAAQEGR